MRLPDPALLLVTDRHQARLPLADIVRAALSAGCRWVSVREKDLSDEDQTALALTLLPIARRHGARLTLHSDAALAKACGSDGVHLSAGRDPAASRALLGPGKLIGVSVHTATEAEAIDPRLVDYAIAGPAFETPSKPGYGPEIGHKGLAEIAAAAPVPVLAIGGLNATRAAEVLAAGPVGIAVMGSIMRAIDRCRGSSPRAIGRHALVRQPHICGQLALLPEDVDRHAAARVPVAADAQEFRLEQGDEFLADSDGAILVERADITEAAEIKLERLRLQQPSSRRVVDDEVCKIGLSGDRTERGEFRHSKARDIVGVGMGICDAIERRRLRRSGKTARLAEMTKRFGHCLHSRPANLRPLIVV